MKEFELFQQVFLNIYIVERIQSFLPFNGLTSYSDQKVIYHQGNYYNDLFINDFYYLAGIKFGFIDQINQEKPLEITSKLLEAIISEYDHQTFQIFNQNFIEPIINSPYKLYHNIINIPVLCALIKNKFVDYLESYLYNFSHIYSHSYYDYFEILECAIKSGLKSDQISLILSFVDINKPNIMDIKYNDHNYFQNKIIMLSISYLNPDGILSLLDSVDYLELKTSDYDYIFDKLWETIQNISSKLYNPNHVDETFYYSTYYAQKIDVITNNYYKVYETSVNILENNIKNPGVVFELYYSQLYNKIKNNKRKYIKNNIYKEIIIAYHEFYNEINRFLMKGFLNENRSTQQNLIKFQEVFKLLSVHKIKNDQY